MRLRRAKVKGPFGEIEVDFRNSEGRVMDVCGLIGGNCSGKSLITTLIARLWLTGSVGIEHFATFSEIYVGIDAEVEYEIGSGICTAVMRSGRVVQPLVSQPSQIDTIQVSEACLLYSTGLRAGPLFLGKKEATLGERAVGSVLSDLYRREVRNSVILIDDIELGLDDISLREFLRVLTRKSLERNNQLVVAGRRDLEGYPLIRLSRRVNIIEEALRSLSNKS